MGNLSNCCLEPTGTFMSYSACSKSTLNHNLKETGKNMIKTSIEATKVMKAKYDNTHKLNEQEIKDFLDLDTKRYHLQNLRNTERVSKEKNKGIK